MGCVIGAVELANGPLLLAAKLGIVIQAQGSDEVLLRDPIRVVIARAGGRVGGVLGPPLDRGRGDRYRRASRCGLQGAVFLRRPVLGGGLLPRDGWLAASVL